MNAAAAPPSEVDAPLPNPGREAYRLVERRSARARYIRLEIRPAAEVRLIYPRWASRDQALAFLVSRQHWIEDKLREQRQRDGAAAARPLAWDGEDELLFEGAPCRLGWVEAPGRQPQLQHASGRLTLLWPYGKAATPALLERGLRAALLQWARAEAQALVASEAARLGVTVTALRLNDPQRQWGSCTAAGHISVSWRLLLAPPVVFRYVVVHELCHLRHPDHSPRFWALVAQQLPDYAAARDWLRAHGNRLQNCLPRRARG